MWVVLPLQMFHTALPSKQTRMLLTVSRLVYVNGMSCTCHPLGLRFELRGITLRLLWLPPANSIVLALGMT